jgi:hypothetical protein
MGPPAAQERCRPVHSRSLAAVDAFLAICQAIGIGIAVGAIAGAAGLEGGARGGITLLAAAIGAAAGAVSASADDESIVLGALAGLLAAGLAAAVVSDVVAGAGRREAGGAGPLALLVALAGLAVAGVSILLPPLALGPLAGLLWLAAARRRRAQRKYEGLRVLR